MNKIGFIGMGAMGLPMAVNLVKKSGMEVLGFDIVETQKEKFKSIGGSVAENQDDIYKECDIVFQSLPSHSIITDSFERAMKYGKKGLIVIDTSSTAPDIIIDYEKRMKDEGMYLLDSPISGGVPGAENGTLAIMVGGNEDIYSKVEPILKLIGYPMYTGGSGSGDVTKLVNNLIGGAVLVAYAEGYAFAAKAGIDLKTTFDATKSGFLGGPCYENKIPKIINRDYEPGARIAVHRKDIVNAKDYAHKMGIDLPMTDVVLMVMDWMKDNGYINEDQAAMVRYYEDKMNVTVGEVE